MTNRPVLVRVELAFRSTDDQDPQALGDRIREAVAMIVGREALEEFRVRSMPLDVKPKGNLRPVD
jgi:predicted component of type VI protein secretion system